MDIGEGNILSDEISESSNGKIFPGDNESPFGEEESPSGCDETPSVKEGRKNDATASVSKGIGGNTGTKDTDCTVEIEGSYRVLEVLFEKVGSMSSAFMRFSRLEVMREDHTPKLNSPSE